MVLLVSLFEDLYHLIQSIQLCIKGLLIFSQVVSPARPSCPPVARGVPPAGHWAYPERLDSLRPLPHCRRPHLSVLQERPIRPNRVPCIPPALGLSAGLPQWGRPRSSLGVGGVVGGVATDRVRTCLRTTRLRQRQRENLFEAGLLKSTPSEIPLCQGDSARDHPCWGRASGIARDPV